MGDIYCAKCREPWDSYGVRNGDMEEEESKRFLKGEGCPSCRFGRKGILQERIDERNDPFLGFLTSLSEESDGDEVIDLL